MNVVADTKERFHFLDGLRGIAASMIVIHHAFTAHIIKLVSPLKLKVLSDFVAYFTQSGVALFFVLSGVVLLRPYLRGQRELHTADYFYRRLKRIYPPYFFALLFGALVVWLNNAFPTWYNIHGLRTRFSWPETFKELFIVSFDGTYYNLAWWSLQLEILFYILAPFIIFLFPRGEKITGRFIVFSIVITLVAIFTLQNILTNNYDAFGQIYSYMYQVANIGKFIEYLVCFLLGVLLAARDFKLKEGYYLVITGAILIVLSLLLFRHAHTLLPDNFIGFGFIPNASEQSLWIYLSFMHSGYGLFYAGIIVLAFNIVSLKRFLSRPLMIWLGERSYSLFLIHFSVFYLVDNIVSHFTPERNALYAVLTRGVGIPLALFAAMLLFHFVERRQARGLMTGNMFWPWQARS